MLRFDVECHDALFEGTILIPVADRHGVATRDTLRQAYGNRYRRRLDWTTAMRSRGDAAHRARSRVGYRAIEPTGSYGTLTLDRIDP
jgi:hypothetical protein